jgi:hypothetical protein
MRCIQNPHFEASSDSADAECSACECIDVTALACEAGGVRERARSVIAPPGTGGRSSEFDQQVDMVAGWGHS